MNVIKEIEALKKVVEILSPLDEDSRLRVIAYTENAFRTKVASAAPPSQESRSSPRSSGDQKPIAAQEYLRRYNYKVMTKRIAVVAVFLERERGMRRFAFRDITEAFRTAKEPKTPAPSQYARAVIMGYLAKEGDQYYATSQAESLVDGYRTERQETEPE